MRRLKLVKLNEYLHPVEGKVNVFVNGQSSIKVPTNGHFKRLGLIVFAIKISSSEHKALKANTERSLRRYLASISLVVVSTSSYSCLPMTFVIVVSVPDASQDIFEDSFTQQMLMKFFGQPKNPIW